MEDVNIILERVKTELRDGWMKWSKEIPYMSFPNNWKVQIIPPFGGAMIRFRVKHGEGDISVYLDVADRLGYFGSPYWEIYPYGGDIYRVPMNDVDELLMRIQMILDGKDSE